MAKIFQKHHSAHLKWYFPNVHLQLIVRSSTDEKIRRVNVHHNTTLDLQLTFKGKKSTVHLKYNKRVMGRIPLLNLKGVIKIVLLTFAELSLKIQKRMPNRSFSRDVITVQNQKLKIHQSFYPYQA